ncbi:hypothetical protein A3D71_04165 [Candidatus Kaiserbacteria bacterium RIFCSPHIGHO2_02_FULL_55_20]|uniref:Uncharacterized protein n=1 Tax=Candidatus Kaiserbacteria bacterium RIFCSPHIGHO2_02_FULL_55_20 TaxID=1798497 RepID=A0A1F6DYK5_9BACT|nr:MAG: hypothetical protein A2680_03340 [Candidatus Kaiserbacteria bacterium RIFCSPHIGHO2_01_FULL_55_37]OGG66505.1 MAG: hypothetical protein A3D71_04165 [Candidatus Kaiserbacteria bacterium RIFCSPHIGHO2_02_FULL_55_20]
MVQDISALYESGAQVEMKARMPLHDSAREYTFLGPLNVNIPDILLHKDVLTESGILAFPPARSVLSCMVEKTARGPRATKVLRFVREAAGVEPPPKKPSFGPEVMTLKGYRPSRGFGFFTREDGTDVFVHITVLERCGIACEAMVEGAEFNVTYEPSVDGFRATKVER